MENLWEFLSEPFDQSLPRMAAAFVKETPDSLCFAYPAEDGRIGWCVDKNRRTGYDQPPRFQIDFAAYESPGISSPLCKCRPLPGRMLRRPGEVLRAFAFTNLGIYGEDRLGGLPTGGLRWELSLRSRTEEIAFDKTLYTVLSAREPFRAELDGGLLTVYFADESFTLAPDFPFTAGLFQSPAELERELAAGGSGSLTGEGYLLAIGVRLTLEPEAETRLAWGISSAGPRRAEAARDCADMEERIAEHWNSWFAALPDTGCTDERQARAIYKSWQTIRENDYNHPEWGHCVTEALPVYKGIWQWAMPSVEWHADQNSERCAQWTRKAMDMLCGSQREDGYITHAIYIDDEIPGEIWLNCDVVQTPHLPWAALRYFSATGDLQALRHWFPCLESYYRFLCARRDPEARHLWAITTSFDCGLDTFPAFQSVTYGVDGNPPEPYCYPTIFAAERFRYEQAMARLCELLEEPGAEDWRAEAERTRAAMEYLWDAQASWYGVRHADGSLDTRVGVDGLFPLAYRMVEPARAAELEPGFTRLIGPYGVRTCAEGEKGFRADVYWRGPAWPKSCSLGAAACAHYYPHLAERVYQATVDMALSNPNIWECVNASTGELARSDMGFVCTPGVSSNVGAGDVLGSIWIYQGFGMYDFDWIVPLRELSGVHAGGLRVDVRRRPDGWELSARPAERSEGTILVRQGRGAPIRVKLDTQSPVLLANN